MTPEEAAEHLFRRYGDDAKDIIRLTRNALQGAQNFGRYHASSSVIDPLKHQ